MSDVHEHAVPRIHVRLYQTRVELERMTDLARALARALDAEVDARHGLIDRETVARETAHVLHEARLQGLP